MSQALRTWINLFCSQFPGTGDPPIMPSGSLLPPPMTVTEQAEAAVCLSQILSIVAGTTPITPGGLDPNGPQG